MLTYGPVRPKRPPQRKEGRYKGTDRPNEGSITRWDHQNRPGVSGRDDRGRPLGPILLLCFFLRLVTHSSQYIAATDLIEIRNALTPRSSGHKLGTVPMSQNKRPYVSLSAP